ncbi:MAG: PIN domain-containing protein [Solirubrobacterales bacterium]
MTDNRGPVVVDTDVFSAVLAPESALARRYDPILLGRPVILCFQTEAELRFGALRRGWGDRRLQQLDAEIGRAAIVHSGPQLVATYVDLRVACEQAGHALGQREHDADRWIAATALRLGIPLVSNDRIFEDAPGMRLESAHR